MTEIKKCRTLAVHSYKGGTGKTQIALNMALLWAKKGLKVCLLDYDFRAPSIGALLGIDDTPYWINDYLLGSCEIEKVLVDVSTKLGMKGKLLLGLANPSVNATGQMIGQNEKAQLKSLRRTIDAQNTLPEKYDVDYIIIDTSPGPQYSSLNAVFASDILLIVLRNEKVDIAGTLRMMENIYEGSLGEKAVVINMISPNVDSVSVQKKLEDKLRMPIVGVILCYCDFAASAGELPLALANPKHGFIEALTTIGDGILPQ